MQQPKPISRKYDEMLRNTEEGIYQIPKFQRDFVWSKEQSAKLLDSLIKGFPIGTFILWKSKDRLKSLKKIGGAILKEAKESDFVYYILDGQQRITSLFLILKGEIAKNKDNKEVSYKEIYIDLDKNLDSDDEICTVSKPQNCISVYELMNEGLLDLSEKFGKDIARKIETFKKCIESYEFATIEIENQSLDKIAEIFTRINTSGKSLTLFEIMNAKVYDEKLNFDLEEKFDNFIQDLRNIGYESLAENKQSILQLISLIIKKDCISKAILSIDKQDFIKNWDLAIECLRLAIDKVRDSLKIPVSKLLPYPVLLLSFAYFYFLNDKKAPKKSQLDQLEIYFFRSAFFLEIFIGNRNKIKCRY